MIKKKYLVKYYGVCGNLEVAEVDAFNMEHAATIAAVYGCVYSIEQIRGQIVRVTQDIKQAVAWMERLSRENITASWKCCKGVHTVKYTI